MFFFQERGDYSKRQIHVQPCARSLCKTNPEPYTETIMKTYTVLLFTAIAFVALAGSASAADSTGPTVGTVSPLSAIYGIAQTYSVTAGDTSGVASCSLLVSSVYETAMTYSEGLDRWETSYTFTTERSANSIRAVCEDALGNVTTGKSRIISVSGSPIQSADGAGDTTPQTSEVDATGWSRDEVIAVSPVLIKTACPGGEDYTHPCRTVYFLDNDGQRHAFPNEKVYFTWYADYTDLHIVSASTMSSFTLGKNVTYHPGTKMVKFPSVRTVYAVERHGVLRAIGSEETARNLYGDSWNQLVDDISEAFFGNYSLGSSVSTSSDYNVSEQTASTESINDNL